MLLCCLFFPGSANAPKIPCEYHLNLYIFTSNTSQHTPSHLHGCWYCKIPPFTFPIRHHQLYMLLDTYPFQHPLH